MNETASNLPKRWFRFTAWALGGITALFVFLGLLYPVIFGPHEGISRIDSEPAVLQKALAQYKTEFGSFPTGDSRAICQALSGKNPKGIRFIEFPPRATSPDGDFLDPWGTPYKIYFSAGESLIRSAGPNKRFESSTKQRGADDYFGG